jgi:hypothetical protein
MNLANTPLPNSDMQLGLDLVWKLPVGVNLQESAMEGAAVYDLVQTTHFH